MRFRTARNGRPRRPLSRAQLLIGLTAALTALFGVTAWRTASADRRNVEEATCMFAASAAHILQARAQVFLALVSNPVFAAVGGRAPAAPTEPLPSPALLAQASAKVKDCHCAPELPTTRFFRFDLDGNTLSQLTLAPALNAGSPRDGRAIPDTAIGDTIGLRWTLTSALPYLRGTDVFAAGVRDSSVRPDSIRTVAIVMGKYGTDGHLRAVYGLVEPTVPFVRAISSSPFSTVWGCSPAPSPTPRGARDGPAAVI